MNVRSGLAALVLLAAGLGACQVPDKGPVSKFSPEELKALFPADLGPAFVDVAGYPAEQRLNYGIFAEKCSTCHTLARAVNSPLVGREAWTRYVARMHGRAKRTPWFGGPLLTAGEARRVIEFLAFDSEERKVKRAAEFAHRLDVLEAVFAEAQDEKARVQAAQGIERARASSPYVGDRR